MTKTFAASQTQADRAIKSAALAAVRSGMILTSEVAETIKAATFALSVSGSAYVCGATIKLTIKAQDTRRAASIRSMSDAQFNRFAVGM